MWHVAAGINGRALDSGLSQDVSEALGIEAVVEVLLV